MNRSSWRIIVAVLALLSWPNHLLALEMDSTADEAPGSSWLWNGTNEPQTTAPSRTRNGKALHPTKVDEETVSHEAPPATPVDRPKSRIENYFFRPAPPVGATVSGAIASEQLVTDTESIRREQEREFVYSRLLADGLHLTLPERVALYQKLDLVRRQKYLQFLTPPEREVFLPALGELERWYPKDLKTTEIDRNLKQFGYDFFANTTGGFAVERLAPVGPDYVVGPGDTLVVSLWGSVDGAYEVTVDRSGNIFLPKVGAIQVWGQPSPPPGRPFAGRLPAISPILS